MELRHVNILSLVLHHLCAFICLPSISAPASYQPLMYLSDSPLPLLSIQSQMFLVTELFPKSSFTLWILFPNQSVKWSGLYSNFHFNTTCLISSPRLYLKKEMLEEIERKSPQMLYFQLLGQFGKKDVSW